MSDLPPVRTVAEPMTFSREEFWRGAYGAWGWYLVAVVGIGAALGIGGGAFFFGVLVYSLPIAVTVSMVAVLVWSPLAYLLGRALRRVRRMSVHLLGFAVLGAILGSVTIWIFSAVMGAPAFLTPFLASYALAPAIAMPFAWWRTARRALRGDAMRRGPVRSDPDAAAEDALAEVARRGSISAPKRAALRARADRERVRRAAR